MRHRHDAGGNRRRAAAAGRAGGAARIPRVVGHAVGAGSRGPVHRKFRHCRLADNHDARLFEPAHEFGVMLGPHGGARGPAGACGLTAVMCCQILQQKGHALERALPKVVPYEAPGFVLEGRDDCVELAVDRIDARQRRIQQFVSGDLAFGDEFGEPGGVIFVIFGELQNF